MLQVIYFLAVLLIVFSIALTIIVGLFIGVTYLIMYFLPSIALSETLIPAAILTITPIIIFGSIVKELMINQTDDSNEFYLDQEDV